MLRTPVTSPYYSPAFLTDPSHRIKNRHALSNISILVSAFLAILATGGPTYSFGVYATNLKTQLGLTQSQLDTLGSASFAAGLISWIPGLCVDAWGSRKALLLGGCFQSLGLALYWFVARFAYLVLPASWWIPVLCALSTLIFTSNNLVIGGVFKSIVVSCELGTKGKAVGAAKAYLGMGAGVFSTLFRAMPNTNSDLDFLLMSSVLALVAIVLPSALGLPTKEDLESKGTKDESTNQHYNVAYGGIFCLAVVVVGASVLSLFQGGAESIVPKWLHGTLILALWVGPVLALFWLPTQSSSRNEYSRSYSASIRRRVRATMERDFPSPSPNEHMRLLGPSRNSNNNNQTYKQAPIRITNGDDESEDDVVCETPQPVQDRTLTEMLTTLPAWLFLGASIILVGAGTMLTINMGSIVQSRGLNPQLAAACLAIFSVAQAIARVAAGAVSESALQWKTELFGIRGVPRPTFLVLSCAFAVAGHACLAMSSKLPLLIVGVSLTGFSFGALWPLMVLIVGDLFGTVNHGGNYMFCDGITCSAGTLLIAKFLTQFVYEQHIEGGETACFGDDCFRLTHAIVSGLCLISLLASMLLLYMTRSSYGTLKS